MTYEKSVDAIKAKIENYSKYSILRKSISFFYSIGDEIEERARSMPHLIFLLIKWSMLKKNEGDVEISDEEFYNIANDIHELQHLAVNLKPGGNLALKLRVMLMQQTIPQKSFQSYIETLVRQKLWFTKHNNNYYAESFKKSTGVTMAAFYSVAIYLSAHTLSNQPKIKSIKFDDLAKHLSPNIELGEIALVVKMLGLKIDEIPNYLMAFELPFNPKIEYFQETPFINKPIIIEDGHLTIIDNYLLLKSMSDFASRVLKKNDLLFKNHFGPTLEQYICDIFTKKNIIHQTESGIKLLYKEIGMQGKVVDFLLDGVSRVYIDSKAIEPSSLVATSHDPEILRGRLETSYIKAIFQGQECCHILSTHPAFKNKNSYLLVVVHQDHYIATGARIEELVQHSLTGDIKRKFGYIPIPLANIYYITIDDLERLSEIESEKPGALLEILEASVKRDERPETQYMLFKMHLDEYRAFKKNKELQDLCIQTFSEHIKDLKKNIEHWGSGKNQFHLARQKLKKLLNQGN